MKFHILSYNIHKGFSMRQKFVLQKIKEAIQKTGADLVFLQEVLGEHKGHKERIEEWPVEPQLEYLADKVWPHHAYGKNAIYSDGHHGNALMSQLPIAKWENIDISTNSFERRGILHATIALPKGKELHAVCIHLNLLQKSRIQQVEMLCKRIEEHVPHDAPLIIAGDFNDWKEIVSDTLEEQLDVKEVFLEKTGEHARSFPSWLPLIQLDRIYCRGLKIKKAATLTGEPWNKLSDHLALYAELEL